MIKLYRKIAVFLLPLALLWSLLPLDRRAQFAGLDQDCEDHALDIYDRLQSADSIELALLGSSRILNGVDDRLLSQLTDLQVYNLGYCRLGHNLELSLLDLLLDRHQPKVVLLEVAYKERRFSHPVFPYLARPAEVLQSYPNKDWLKDVWKNGLYRTELLRNQYLSTKPSRPERTTTFTYDGLSGQLAMDQFPDKQAERTTNYRVPAFSQHYLELLSERCRERGITLYFLYLPAYEYHHLSPAAGPAYYDLGRLLLPPEMLFARRENWFDDNHLNQQGAKELTYWLAEQLTIPD